MRSSARIGGTAAMLLCAIGGGMPRSAHGAESQSLAIVVEQNGAAVLAVKNEVTLRKAPFRILVTLIGADAVATDASTSDEVFKAAKKRGLSEPFTNQFKALPLEDKNAGETLFVVEDPLETRGVLRGRWRDLAA